MRKSHHYKRSPSPKKEEKKSPAITVAKNTHIITFAWNLKDILELLRDYIKSPAFASLFDVRTVISLSSVCRSFHEIFNKAYLQLVIRLGNLDSSIRWQLWTYKVPCAKYEFINMQIE